MDVRALGQAVAADMGQYTGCTVQLVVKDDGAGDMQLVAEGALDASMTSLCLAVASAFEPCAAKVRPYSGLARTALA
jgi:hypothetical protein